MLNDNRVVSLVRRARALTSGWGEADLKSMQHPLTFLPPEGKCRSVVMCTKLFAAQQVAEHRPRGVAVIGRAGLLDGCSTAMVADVVGRWECPLWFVGDLDAFDLLVFLHRRMQLQAAGVELRYRGVDHRWVSVCRQYAKSAEKGIPTTRMDKTERAFVVSLLAEVPELERVVGPEAAGLLRQGERLELEGASNPAMYTRGFARKLVELLFGTGDGPRG